MPEAGEKLALIAMVVVLSKCSRAEEARRGALARGQVLSRQTDDRLEGVLQTILFFCGDALKIPEGGTVPLFRGRRRPDALLPTHG